MSEMLGGRLKPVVAILGVGHSIIGRDRTDLSLQELIFEGVTATLANAGLTRDDLDCVVLSCSDTTEGRSIGSMTTAAAAGAYMKHEIRTTNDGLYGLALGAMEILSGRARIVQVASWTKLSEGDWPNASIVAAEPFYERPVGIRDLTALGLAASEMVSSDPSVRQMATKALQRNRRNGAANPRAPQTAVPSDADIDESSMVCWPLREIDLPSPTDAALGMILVHVDVAKASGRPYALLTGLAWGEAAGLSNRTAIRDVGLNTVAARAYASASLTELADIDVIELVSRSSFDDVAILDGLIQPLGGNAAQLIADGSTERDGTIPVNPSGGSNGTYAMQSAGLWAAMEVVQQLMGTAGAVQVSSPQVGVAHGQSGPAAQGNVVAIFTAAKDVHG